MILTLVVLAVTIDDPRCTALAALALPNTTITSAQWVAPGPFTPPAPVADAALVANVPASQPIALPAHCRVAAVTRPSSDSHIEIEVWLPAADWNGKFQAVGNGGWAGSLCDRRIDSQRHLLKRHTGGQNVQGRNIGSLIARQVRKDN